MQGPAGLCGKQQQGARGFRSITSANLPKQYFPKGSMKRVLRRRTLSFDGKPKPTLMTLNRLSRACTPSKGRQGLDYVGALCFEGPRPTLVRTQFCLVNLGNTRSKDAMQLLLVLLAAPHPEAITNTGKAADQVVSLHQQQHVFVFLPRRPNDSIVVRRHAEIVSTGLEVNAGLATQGLKRTFQGCRNTNHEVEQRSRAGWARLEVLAEELPIPAFKDRRGVIVLGTCRSHHLSPI